MGEAGETALEFEVFTPEAAAMLVAEPGLGAPETGRRSRRLFRVAAPGARPPEERFVVRSTRAAAPVAQLHLRLSEREAHEAPRRSASRRTLRWWPTLAPPRRRLPGRVDRAPDAALSAKAEPRCPRSPGGAREASIDGALAALSGRFRRRRPSCRGREGRRPRDHTDFQVRSRTSRRCRQAPRGAVDDDSRGRQRD